MVKKILIIPDVHLKLFMFYKADKILQSGRADMAIFLGDLVDDWGCNGNTLLYKATIDKCIEFKEKYPLTKYCFGNHELAYWFTKPCSGTDLSNIGFVAHLIGELRSAYGPDAQVIHRIGSILFSHAGLTTNWLNKFYQRELELQIGDDDLLERINDLNDKDMRLWDNDSPVWARVQHQEYLSKFDRYHLWKPDEYFQIVGHTPLEYPEQEGNLLSCDTFSTYSDGSEYGKKDFVIFDLDTREWEKVYE